MFIWYPPDPVGPGQAGLFHEFVSQCELARLVMPVTENDVPDPVICTGVRYLRMSEATADDLRQAERWHPGMMAFCRWLRGRGQGS